MTTEIINGRKLQNTYATFRALIFVNSTEYFLFATKLKYIVLLKLYRY